MGHMGFPGIPGDQGNPGIPGGDGFTGATGATGKVFHDSTNRVVSMLDSGAVGPGFKSQSGNSPRQTVHTHRASL